MGSRLLRKSAPVLVLAAALLGAYLPSAFGSSNGMNQENGAYPSDFDQYGCTSCHGTVHEFPATQDRVSYQLTFENETGAMVDIVSGSYEHDATYTVHIRLNESVPGGDNAAGFYLEASAGEFAIVDGDESVQITSGGTEASHTEVGNDQTEWSFLWTAPESGAVVFELLVNDVNGDGAAAEGDLVYREFFALTDEEGAQLGAAEEHEEHFGVALPQYWLGLIALASMIFVILFAFVYLKFVSPHNADQKDR